MSKRQQGQTKGSGKPRQAGSERQPPRRGTSPADREFARRLAEAPPQAAYRLLDPEAVREAHRVVLPGSVLATAQGPYFQPTAPDGTSVLAEHGMAQVADALARMQPRDPLEEMLVQQTLWVHARIGHLTRIANTQQGLEQIAVIGEALERAHNTYRRLMLALAEYRNPKPVKSFTAIKQVNKAEQQVIQNNAGPAPAQPESSESSDEKPRNEKGCGHAPALPPVSEGVDLAAEIGRARAAVAEHARASHGGG